MNFDVVNFFIKISYFACKNVDHLFCSPQARIFDYFACRRHKFWPEISVFMVFQDKLFGFSRFFHGFMVELHLHGFKVEWESWALNFKYMLSDITVNIIFEYQNAVDRNWNPFGHYTALPTYTIKLIMDFFYQNLHFIKVNYYLAALTMKWSIFMVASEP